MDVPDATARMAGGNRPVSFENRAATVLGCCTLQQAMGDICKSPSSSGGGPSLYLLGKGRVQSDARPGSNEVPPEILAGIATAQNH